jgi:hypothetical protein
MSYLNALKTETNYTRTANGALSHKSTGSKLYDLYAMAGAYRNRSDADVILLFKNAYEENRVYAMRCLFYIRDIIGGGIGERRFFRVCYRWLINSHLEEARKYLERIPEYGRWDDLIYVTHGTKLWQDAISIIKNQLKDDMVALKSSQTAPVSLLGKWLPSENTSSAETRALAVNILNDLHLTRIQYRKMLTKLRERINIVEKLMSSNQWDKIDFSKLPSRAGFKYRKCYVRRDETRDRYKAFIESKETKVHAATLYPVDVVHSVTQNISRNWYSYGSSVDVTMNSTERAAINKYWDNLSDYFNKQTFNGIAVVDTSGSMTSSYGRTDVCPIDVAISLGLYCADKAKGPFHNHFISFSRTAKLIETEGIDFVDKVVRIYRQNLCENTNIESVFNLLLGTAVKHRMKNEDLPKNIIIISDMQFDAGNRNAGETQMETWHRKFKACGYDLPHLVYWNVNASSNQIADNSSNVTYVSGFSPSIFEQIMSGKTGYDLMMDKLNSDRYSFIE